MAAEAEEKEDDNWSEAMTFDPNDQTSKDNTALQVSSPKTSEPQLPVKSNARLPASNPNVGGTPKNNISSQVTNTAGRKVNDRNDKMPITANPQRQPRCERRARSRNTRQCQKHFQEMIGRHEIRNEDLEQQEEDMRQRLQALECSVPAVMIWNIWRMAQGAPTSAIRRLAEKQFQGLGANNITVPSTPSQHWDDRVRKIEAERKEALRRAEEARSLLAEKEAAVRERRKRLEEAKKCNQERKEQIEKLAREATELREALKNARGDDNSTSCLTGECGEIRCKEKWRESAGSVSSIGSTDLESFSKLQELAEAEIGMKRQISELERREEAYMRTLQQADEMWTKMEGDAADTVGDLQDQLDAKTAANQQLAHRVCVLEDELERLKKKLISSKDELSKFTDKKYTEVKTGLDDGVAGVKDRAVAAAIKTAAVSVAAVPRTLDQESLAYPEIKDKESSVPAPEVADVGLSAFPKMSHRSNEAMQIADQVDRGVEPVTAIGVDAHVGPEEDVPEHWKNWNWDEGCPPDIICDGPVECSTETDDSSPKGVPKIESNIQAAPVMVEQPVGGRGVEDMANASTATKGTAVMAKAGDKGDEVSVSLEELRNWYNIVDSVHHAIAKRDSLSSKTDAIAQLAEKMKYHLRIKSPSGVKGPIIMDEIPREPTGVVKEDISTETLIAPDEQMPGTLTPPTEDMKEEVTKEPSIATEDHVTRSPTPSTADVKEEIPIEPLVASKEVLEESAIATEDHVPTPPTGDAQEEIPIESLIASEEQMPESLAPPAEDIKEEVPIEPLIDSEKPAPEDIPDEIDAMPLIDHIDLPDQAELSIPEKLPLPEEIKEVAQPDILEKIDAMPLIDHIDLPDQAELSIPEKLPLPEEIKEVAQPDILEKIDAMPLIDHVELPDQAELSIPEKLPLPEEIKEVAQPDILEKIDAMPLIDHVELPDQAELSIPEKLPLPEEIKEVAQPDLPEISVPSEKAVISELAESVELPAAIAKTAEIVITPVVTHVDVEAPKILDDIADAAKLPTDLLAKPTPVVEEVPVVVEQVPVVVAEVPVVVEEVPVVVEEVPVVVAEVPVVVEEVPVVVEEVPVVVAEVPVVVEEVPVVVEEVPVVVEEVPVVVEEAPPVEKESKGETVAALPEVKVIEEPAEIRPEDSLVKAPKELLEKAKVELPGPAEVEVKSKESIKIPIEESVPTPADDLTKPELATSETADEVATPSDDEKIRKEPAEVPPEVSEVEALIEPSEKPEVELPELEKVDLESEKSPEAITETPVAESVVISAEDLTKPESAITTPAEEIAILPDDEKIREEPLEAAPEGDVIEEKSEDLLPVPTEVDVEAEDSTEPTITLSPTESVHSAADDIVKPDLIASEIVDEIIAGVDLKEDSTPIPEEYADSVEKKEEPLGMFLEEGDIKSEVKPDETAEEIATMGEAPSSSLTLDTEVGLPSTADIKDETRSVSDIIHEVTSSATIVDKEGEAQLPVTGDIEKEAKEMPELVAEVSDLTKLERLESHKVPTAITVEGRPEPVSAISEIQEGVAETDSKTKPKTLDARSRLKVEDAELEKDISRRRKVIVVPDRAVVAKPYLAIAKVESAEKVELPKPVDSCICKPRTCPLLGQSTSREPKRKAPRVATDVTQTTSPIPKFLQERIDKQKLKTVSESTRSHSEVGMCRQPTTWPRRPRDKSTLTTVCVDTQTDSALARDRTALAGITRKDDYTCSGTCPGKSEHGGPIQQNTSRTAREKRTAPACLTVAKSISSAKCSTRMISRVEKEVAVVRYTGRVPVSQGSEHHCAECGKPMTPEGTPLSTKSALPMDCKSQKSLLASLKKLASCGSRISHKKDDRTCCECKTSSKLKTVGGSRDRTQKYKESGKKRSDQRVCCPGPSEITGKAPHKSSKKRRKPETKDQSTMAHIPKSTVKAFCKDMKGTNVHKNKSSNDTASEAKFDNIQIKMPSKVMSTDTVSCCECEEPSNEVSIASGSCDCLLRESISRGSSCNCIKDKT